jgi:hypothetical protein
MSLTSAGGDVHGQSPCQRRKSHPTTQRRIPVRRIRKVADMKPTSPTEAPRSPAPGILPEQPSLIHEEPVASTRQDSRPADGTTSQPMARRAPLARLMAALRGDKYMVDAYPPDGSPTKDG